MRAVNTKTQLMTLWARLIKQVKLILDLTCIIVYLEIVEVEFDQNVVTYESLVKYFLDHHDPTAPHKTQYRSVILYADDEQKDVANRALETVMVCFWEELHNIFKKF